MRPSLHARINGAGPTGALTALALAQAGWRVNLHDPLSPEALQGRERAYAFTQSSRTLLERLGLWSELGPHLVPFHRLRLQDGATGRRVTFDPTDLEHAGAVGWIGSHLP